MPKLFKYEKVRKAFNPAKLEPIFSVNVLDNVGVVLYSTPDQDNFTDSQADDFGKEVVEYLEGLGESAFVQNNQSEAPYAKAI